MTASLPNKSTFEWTLPYLVTENDVPLKKRHTRSVGVIALPCTGWSGPSRVNNNQARYMSRPNSGTSRDGAVRWMLVIVRLVSVTEISRSKMMEKINC